MIINPADRLADVGEYYFSMKLKEVARLREEGKDIINLGIGSPDLAPPQHAITQLVAESGQPGGHGYQSYQGIPELREAISHFYKRHYQVALEQREILPLMGSKEGIMHLSLAYLNPGDGVLIPELSYPTYTSVSRLVQAQVHYYPLLQEEDWQPDWNELSARIDSRTKLIWLNYPHMPTGAQGSLDVFRRFVKLAKEKKILLCHDNPYSFIRNESPISIFQVDGAREVAVELSSLSKTFNMAGWRVGWMCGASELLEPVLKVKSNMDSGMFRPIQKAAACALNVDKHWLTELNREYARRQEIVSRLLDTLGCSYSSPQSGLFMWAKTTAESGRELSDRLLYDRQVFVTPGDIFGKKGRNYIRVSLCQPVEVLKTALKRLL